VCCAAPRFGSSGGKTFARAAPLLPMALPCKMDAFGIITRTDRLLSPAANVMLSAIKAAAATVYGSKFDNSVPAR
jgi:hypothetical protein